MVLVIGLLTYAILSISAYSIDLFNIYSAKYQTSNISQPNRSNTGRVCEV